ncbi:siderophore-interacting protein [Pannonibacter phragmitetus]|uniref:siderophore-interacting protein n=1 Tax=Pannonibacter phragmitetus TaxID=121719 RepID=UPI000B970DDC|nr:siderophore-interacting protein [Pannonibacter phragmitetus]
MNGPAPLIAFTTLPSSAPAALLETLVSEMLRNGMDITRPSPEEVVLNLDPNTLGLTVHEGEGLRITVQANGLVPLHRLKQWLMEHLEELQPGTTAALRWSDDDPRDGEVAPPYFHELTVLKKVALSPVLLRLTFKVERMERFGSDGIHVKLLLPPEGRTPVWPRLAANGALILPEGPDGLHMRYYTIKDTRKQAGEIDIDVVRHAGGAVSDWAEACREGDVIGLLGPSGFQHPPLAGPLLLAADGTGAPAVARMIEALAADMDREGTPVSGGGHVVLGLGTDEEALAYLAGTDVSRLGLTVHGLAPEAFDADLELAIRTVFAGTKPAFAWFAGEQQTAQRLRPLFRKDFGLGKGSQYAIAYWTKGKTGMER